MSFTFMEVENNSVSEFLGVTMVGSMVYFNLTIFLSTPLLSITKSYGLFVLIFFAFFTKLISLLFSA